jgi:hypothetical protein
MSEGKDAPRPTASVPKAPRPERQIAFRFGLSAESRAAAYLIAKGFRILARRWKSPVGEIDIVARRRHLLIFVEVKARERLDDAAWSVTDRQRARNHCGRRGLFGTACGRDDPRYPFRCRAGGAGANSAAHSSCVRRQPVITALRFRSIIWMP